MTRRRSTLVGFAAAIALAVQPLAPAVALPPAWQPLPAMPVERTEVTAVAAGGKVVVFGGIGKGLDLLLGSSRVDAYDAATATWTRMPDLPLPLHHAPAVGMGNHVVVVGGYFGLGFLPTASAWFLDVTAAQPRWLPFTPLPAPRGAHGAATDGQRIWIFGGALGYGGLPSTSWVFDSGAWSAIAAFPEPRDHLAGGFVGGKVVAAGGRRLSLETNTGRTDVYDPQTNTWTQAAAMPTPRGGVAAAVLGGRLFVVGGEGPGPSRPTFKTAEVFDPVAGTWSAQPDMPTARHGLGAAAVAGGIHVLGGGPMAGLSYSDAHERLSPV